MAILTNFQKDDDGDRNSRNSSYKTSITVTRHLMV